MASIEEKSKKISVWIIRIGIPLIILFLLYYLLFTRPYLFHKEHEYLGYKYYSSILDPGFNETDAENAIDRLLNNEPEYKWLLDSFYRDGFCIFFEDKLTYALCTVNFMNANDFAACVTFDRKTNDPVNGMFVNYENDNFSEVHFFHELSHYADWKMGFVSSSFEFIKIFKKEYAKSGLGKYYDDPIEFFAQESAYCILNDSYEKRKLKCKYTEKCKASPETHAFIKEFLREMEEWNDELFKCG